MRDLLLMIPVVAVIGALLYLITTCPELELLIVGFAIYLYSSQTHS